MHHRPLASVVALLTLASTGFAASSPVELDTMTVTPESLKEEIPVGPYLQPEWTTRRRFPTTRIYLQQPPGGMGVEQWWRGKFYDNGDSKFRWQTEWEVGLPHRFQLDLYENLEKDVEGTTRHDNFAFELRYALADWGKLPLNPTLYGEYKVTEDGPDVAEYKILLGDELTSSVHWGLNLVYEYELGGEERTQEWQASTAISYAVNDRGWSIGAEAKAASESVKGERDDPEQTLGIGPSLQFRPTRNTHLDMVPLIGVNDDAPDVEAYVVFGFDFGAPGKPAAFAPSSLKSN
ncbi:MAG: transporter [Kiritimatiellia bacterium]